MARPFGSLLIVALLVVSVTTVDAEAAGKKSKPKAKDPVKNGIRVTDKRLNEISGCAIGAKSPNVAWVHNDSGDAARAYAVDLTTGDTVMTVSLVDSSGKALDPSDNEDIAAYNGRLYMADIGDNAKKRKSVRISSFAEPAVPGAQAKKADRSVKLEARSRTLTYVDGAHDAEAFLIDPAGEMIIVEKGNGAVYRAGDDDVLRKVATTGAPLVTGADITSNGSTVLLRTYLAVLRYDRAAGASFDSIWNAVPTSVVGPLLPQAEALCVEPNAKAAWTVSEARGGAVVFYKLPL